MGKVMAVGKWDKELGDWRVTVALKRPIGPKRRPGSARKVLPAAKPSK